MYGLIASILVSMHTNALAQSNIIAIHEETPQGLVRVDNMHYVHEPRQLRPAHVEPVYQPGLTSPDFIHRPTQQPQYTTVIAHMIDCNCYRKIQVRVN